MKSHYAATCSAWVGAAAAAEICASLSERPFALATFTNADWRQRGTRPLVFQLETVEGVSRRAAATALVPPKRSMMSTTVCMLLSYDNRNLSARP